MYKIIMISGKQGSGKTTLSKVLQKKLYEVSDGSFVYVYKFADPLYRIHDKVLKTLKDDYGIAVESPQKVLLQLIGTDWARNTVDNDIWVKCMTNRVQQANSDRKDGIIIIDDLRFENEYNAFPNALRIRLECPRDIRKARTPNWRENENHQSEIGLDDYHNWDGIYTTDGKLTLESLADSAINLFRKKYDLMSSTSK